GLVGVLVGGGITTAGTLWSQRLQMKAALAAERRTREIAASSVALDALSQLLQLPDEAAPDDAGTEWQRRRRELLLVLGTACQDLRGDDLRHRIEEVVSMIELHTAATSMTGDTERQVRSTACTHALSCLGAFRRGDPLPARPDGYARTLDAIDRWVSRGGSPM
ncbi:MAG TPA: hypothetical protein VFM54_17615, partial [Micromonosporaceae bacterium]|nr:hypothetical protein [Micromonosporaceae bacterium]